MVDPKLKDTLSQGYAKLGDISYSISLNMLKGKNNTPSQRKLKDQGIKMSILLKVLFRHISFDDTTNLPILWRISEVQVNKFVRCLRLLGELDKYPIVPALFPNVKPLIVTSGTQGNPGNDGTDGSDANIIVEPKTGEDQIVVESNVVGLVKTYDVSFVARINPILSAVIQGGKIFEIGTSQSVAILLTSTKGTRNIISLVASDPIVDAILQPLVNLTALNNIGSQPATITVNITTQTADESYQFTEYDGKSNIISSDSINFYYPFLYGAASTILTTTHYTALTKYINAKGDYELLLNDTNKYFYLAYPSSYGAVSKILDDNGLNVTSAFTSALINVTSTGLVTNWTVQYRVYRTTIKTSINGKYKLVF